MERLVLLRECASSRAPERSLNDAVARMIAAGVDRSLVLADLHALRAELRALKDEEGEDAVLDVMDRVIGWCSPHMRL